MLEQEQQIADLGLGFEYSIQPEEFPEGFYTGYDMEQEIKRQFGLEE